MTAQVLHPPSNSLGDPTQTDHLWKVIEKQRSIIEELQLSLTKVTEERNDLLKQVNQPSLTKQSRDLSSQHSMEQLYPHDDFGLRRPFKSSSTSTLATAIDPTMSIATNNVSSSCKPTTRQVASSPFDLMFSTSNQCENMLNNGNTNENSITNSNSTVNSRQACNQVSPIQYTHMVGNNSKASHLHKEYPRRQHSAPLEQSKNDHTFKSFSNNTSQQPTIPKMIRYEDDYYDPVAEDYHSPGLSPPMSMSPDTPLSDGNPATPPPPFVPMLTDIMIKVLSSNITTNEKGKDIFSFTIAVGKVSPSSPQGMDQLWCAEKLFSDFINLDYFIKSKHPDLASKLSRLPDKSLFLSKAPSKVDERKNSVEMYIQTVLTLPMTDMSDVCEFLSTNVLEGRSDLPKRKLGYLTKRGKNFGGWKMRFFVLDGPIVNYYENKGGPYLGTINLARAQIGRQVVQSGSGDSFRHAFLILEPKKSAPNGIHRHVLCADSDMERDQWVETMSQFINYDDFGQPPPPPTASDYRQQLNKLLQRSMSDTLDSKKAASGIDLVQSQLQEDDDDKKIKSRNFWGKKMFATNTNGSSSDTNLTHLLQGGLSAEQAMALMNSGELDGLMNGPNGAPIVERGPNQVFGIPLDDAVQVCRISHDYELPALVYRCIEYLEAKDAAQEEGIYRLSGSAAKIKKLKEKFNQEGDVLLLQLDEYNHEVHAIAGLLKMWLRELPGSILTMDLLNDFLHIADIEDRGKRTTELGRLVSLLPLSNYTLLRTLSAHLIGIVQNSGVNKMTLRNLGIVFSATLGIPSLIFNLFLSEFDYVFWTKHDKDQPIVPSSALPVSSPPISSEPTDASSIDLSNSSQPTLLTKHHRRSNRNSIQYTDYAPPSMVNLEHRSEDYVAIIDEDDEENTLGMNHEMYQYHQNDFANVNPTYEYTATVIEPPIRR